MYTLTIHGMTPSPTMKDVDYVHTNYTWNELHCLRHNFFRLASFAACSSQNVSGVTVRAIRNTAGFNIQLVSLT